MPLEVVAGGAVKGQPLVILILATLLRHGNLFASGQVIPGQGGRVVGHLLGSPLGHDAATMDTGTGADINDVVSQPDGIFVVFHHQHGIAQIP